MSMFSRHYVIRRKGEALYWNGGRPELDVSWSPVHERCIRLYDRTSAEKLVAPGGVLAGKGTVEEDE